MNATIAGTVTTFDANGFKDKLAAYVGGGLKASDIKLTITAASVLVMSEIFLPSAASAEAANNKLSNATTVELTAALGVTVESKDPPTVERRMASPQPVEAARLPGYALALIIVVVTLVTLILIGLVILMRKKKLRYVANADTKTSSVE